MHGISKTRVLPELEESRSGEPRGLRGGRVPQRRPEPVGGSYPPFLAAFCAVVAAFRKCLCDTGRLGNGPAARKQHPEPIKPPSHSFRTKNKRAPVDGSPPVKRYRGTRETTNRWRVEEKKKSEPSSVRIRKEREETKRRCQRTWEVSARTRFEVGGILGQGTWHRAASKFRCSNVRCGDSTVVARFCCPHAEFGGRPPRDREEKQGTPTRTMILCLQTGLGETSISRRLRGGCDARLVRCPSATSKVNPKSEQHRPHHPGKVFR